VLLQEGSNTILFQYLAVEAADSPAEKGKTATVGIRAPNATTNQFFTQWSYNAAVLKNNQAILFTPSATAAPADVTSSFSISSSAFVLNRITQRYTGTVTITNRSAAPIARPLTLLLSALPAGVSSPTAAGNLPGEGPFFAVPGSGPLAAGESATVSVQFLNPSNTRITFIAKVYSGNF
jgi:uncharacterized protein